MGGREEECRLGEQSRRHQGRRDANGRRDDGIGADPVGQQHDVQRSVGAVEQRRAQQGRTGPFAVGGFAMPMYVGSPGWDLGEFALMRWLRA